MWKHNATQENERKERIKKLNDRSEIVKSSAHFLCGNNLICNWPLNDMHFNGIFFCLFCCMCRVARLFYSLSAIQTFASFDIHVPLYPLISSRRQEKCQIVWWNIIHDIESAALKRLRKQIWWKVHMFASNFAYFLPSLALSSHFCPNGKHNFLPFYFIFRYA